MSYRSKLQEMGIVESRISNIYDAMNSLHNAISKLDNQQLKIFSSTFGLIGHLDMFAREEGLRNVAVDMYNCALRESVKRIDFEDGFDDFSDKLYYLAQQAHEVKIPGAQQLCRSLCDIRSKYELSRMPFSALAKKALNIAEVHGNACHTKYLYTSDGECIGKALTLWGIDRTDTGESGTRLVFINVELEDMNATDADIRKAINSVYREVGCSHEHDCCGCVSQYPLRMKKLRTNNWHDTSTWVVLMSWYRNV